MLAHQSGFVIVGDDKADPEVRKRLLYRPESFDNYAMVADGELIKRIITVPFDYASSEFKPTPLQAYRMLQLMAVADRVEIRGRTDAVVSTSSNKRMAQRRAMAARNHLIDRGMPSELISINYMASGDPVASPDNERGRSKNRRAEIEFFIDDFATAKRNSCAVQSENMECGL